MQSLHELISCLPSLLECKVIIILRQKSFEFFCTINIYQGFSCKFFAHILEVIINLILNARFNFEVESLDAYYLLS